MLDGKAEEGGRVLVVDDDDLGRRVIARLLGTRFRVMTASSGDHALALLRVHGFDVLLTDQHMLWMTGIELLEQVRMRHPSLRRVLTSATCVPGAETYVAIGLVHAVLYKPFDIATAAVALVGAERSSWSARSSR
jgi:CheY-like chemotaxis protein